MKFVKYNRNPLNRKAGDCVARAISTGTGLKWEDVIRIITEHAIPLGRVFNEKEAYGSWLEQTGWTKHKQPRKPNNKKYTVQEFCDLNPEGIYIVGVAHHLTVVEDGKYYDTWDCGYKTVGNYWSR
jgi:hypothetical protein